jgi:hypothetical protein
MRLFNEQFKRIIKQFPNDVGCKRALVFLEQGNTEPASKWTPERVKKFVEGLRFTVRKRNPYFGYLLDKVPIIVVDPNDRNVRTMAVDQNHNLYINPVFTQSILSGAEGHRGVSDKDTAEANKGEEPEEGTYYTLPEGEKAFLGIIAHELMHIFKDHVARMTKNYKRVITYYGQPVTLWNLATDAEINDELLYKWGYTLVEGGINSAPDGTLEFLGNTLTVRGKTPERIYREMESLLPPPPPKEPLKPGDIVYDEKTKKYGEIVTIDEKTGQAKIAELTREEAKARVMQQF